MLNPSFFSSALFPSPPFLFYFFSSRHPMSLDVNKNNPHESTCCVSCATCLCVCLTCHPVYSFFSHPLSSLSLSLSVSLSPSLFFARLNHFYQLQEMSPFIATRQRVQSIAAMSSHFQKFLSTPLSPSSPSSSSPSSSEKKGKKK